MDFKAAKSTDLMPPALSDCSIRVYGCVPVD